MTNIWHSIVVKLQQNKQFSPKDIHVDMIATLNSVTAYLLTMHKWAAEVRKENIENGPRFGHSETAPTKSKD